METIPAKTAQDPPLEREKISIIAQISLRTLAIGATLAAAWLMFTNEQTATFFGIPFDAKYTYSPATRFFTYANGAACACSLLSLISVSLLYHQGLYPGNNFFLALHDLIMTVLLMAACGAATAIGQLGLDGNSHTGWMPICRDFGKFCDRGKVSVIFSYLAVLIFIILTASSFVHKSK